VVLIVKEDEKPILKKLQRALNINEFLMEKGF
jgi:hypothetical protein